MTTEVDEFINAVTPAVRQRDARTLLDMMTRITGEQPRLWGTIVGSAATTTSTTADAKATLPQRLSLHVRPR